MTRNENIRIIHCSISLIIAGLLLTITRILLRSTSNCEIFNVSVNGFQKQLAKVGNDLLEECND